MLLPRYELLKNSNTSKRIIMKRKVYAIILILVMWCLAIAVITQLVLDYFFYASQ